MSAIRQPWAICHPGERAVTRKGRLCVDCHAEARRERAGTVPAPAAIDRLPATVTRRVFDAIPDRCPKCGNAFLFVDGRRVFCPGVRAGCGSDWYLRESRRLLVALVVSITATLPVNDAVMLAAEQLRQAAITAGCAAPVVSMRWLGGERGIEIAVTCPR